MKNVWLWMRANGALSFLFATQIFCLFFALTWVVQSSWEDYRGNLDHQETPVVAKQLPTPAEPAQLHVPAKQKPS